MENISIARTVKIIYASIITIISICIVKSTLGIVHACTCTGFFIYMYHSQ